MRIKDDVLKQENRMDCSIYSVEKTGSFNREKLDRFSTLHKMQKYVSIKIRKTISSSTIKVIEENTHEYLCKFFLT